MKKEYEINLEEYFVSTNEITSLLRDTRYGRKVKTNSSVVEDKFENTYQLVTMGKKSICLVGPKEGEERENRSTVEVFVCPFNKTRLSKVVDPGR